MRDTRIKIAIGLVVLAILGGAMWWHQSRQQAECDAKCSEGQQGILVNPSRGCGPRNPICLCEPE
jgi:hypothetical protein